MDCIFLYCIVFKVCRFVDLYISMFMFTHYMSVHFAQFSKESDSNYSNPDANIQEGKAPGFEPNDIRVECAGAVNGAFTETQRHQTST